MHPFRLIFREIAYRRVNFALGVIAVVVAVACLVGAVVNLKRFDAQTEQIMAAKEAETRAKMAALEDDYRKITIGLGFNVLILPREQNMSEFFAQDYSTNYMPEAYVERLAKSKIVTIQHLLPCLQQKIKWPETERTILLIGVRGEVPILHADAKKPMLEAVAPGTMVVGHELHRTLNLAVGQKVNLLGKEFTVAKLHPERGTKDDISIWIPLNTAQELLGKEGKVNGIFALECVCAADSLAKVRSEIAGVLPETQIIEFQSQTLARAEARQRAALEAKDALEREKQNRMRLRREKEIIPGIVVPMVTLLAGVCIALLSLANVRERRTEIGLLRALGTRSSRIILMFLCRPIIMGLVAAVPGYLLGLLVGAIWGEPALNLKAMTVWFDLKFFLVMLAGAPVLGALAGWLPSFIAAQQDPAEVLSLE